MAISVRILETFEIVRELGALVVREPRSGREDIVDGPRTVKHVYEKGTRASFASKKAAEDFIAKNPGKAVLA